MRHIVKILIWSGNQKACFDMQRINGKICDFEFSHQTQAPQVDYAG